MEIANFFVLARYLWKHYFFAFNPSSTSRRMAVVSVGLSGCFFAQALIASEARRFLAGLYECVGSTRWILKFAVPSITVPMSGHMIFREYVRPDESNLALPL
jgi:hypothetical protein